MVDHNPRRAVLARCVLGLGLLQPACLQQFVNNRAADALSGTGTVLSSDDDPDLIADAAPFGLKAMESVLAETPRHERLLLSLTSGYAQYGYAFVDERADRVRDDDYKRADHLKNRARKLYKRALAYGLRGLEVRHSNFEDRLRNSPKQLFREMDEADDVPLLYWTAAAWALLIGASDLDPEAVADFPLVEAMARQALEIDEAWDDGALHTLLLSIESNKPGGDLAAAETHFERALALDKGRRAGTYVGMAENVCIRRQDVVRFHRLLDAALAIDVDAFPADRLANVIMQRRAAFLKEHEEDYFLITLEEAVSTSTDSATRSNP